MKTHHLVEIDDSSLNPHLDVIENRFEYISVLLIMNDKKTELHRRDVEW